ncbi:acyltransferase family protein [Kocuria rosea]|uniref:acyltransferase family protein n=1 Tax=Kocuria rosea TaxID=1275 RepID=UPI00203C65CA|nr:acyltransferase [Kocuria rosea]MCM3687836.1 acyltransferase [Kocuria rosea]
MNPSASSAPSTARSSAGAAVLPADVEPSGPPVAPERAGGRDRYLDLLRALALFRIVLYHTFGTAALTLVFPSLGVMFALAGSLMARSLVRPAPTVIRSRARRLLLPLAAFSATLLVLLLVQGWTPTQEEDGSWWDLVVWFLPIGDPVLPESIGDGTGPIDSSWAAEAGIILWYIRAYFWFMLLSPLMLMAFRRFPRVTLLMPLALVACLEFLPLSVPVWAETQVWDFATYGSCWLLGFAHSSGQLRRTRGWIVFAAGAALMALGLWQLATHVEETGWDLNNTALAQALWSLGFTAVLLRISPVWHTLPRPLHLMDRLVTLVNNRAMTIYLWHNLLIVVAAAVISKLWDNESLAERVPWLLETQWTAFFLTWLMIGVMILAVGWVEDIAARRRPRLWPDGSHMPSVPSARGDR